MSAAEMSPGRAVYESLHAAIKRRVSFHDWLPWEAMETDSGIDTFHEDWEAAAEAGHAAIEAGEADDETPAYWQVRAALATALETLQSVALSPHDGLAAMARKTLAGVDERLREPDQADLRPREGEPGWHDVTCGRCGEEFGTNFRVDEIWCAGCEARRCPQCHTWFGAQPDEALA